MLAHRPSGRKQRRHRIITGLFNNSLRFCTKFADIHVNTVNTLALETRPTLIVVEDDDPIREYLQEVLEGEGYDCMSFSRCSQALEHLLTSGQTTDLILSDISMPGMNGLEFLRAARTANCTVPFILLSGGYELSFALEAMQNGAADYLLKPASPADILNLVVKYISAGKSGTISRACCAPIGAEQAFSTDLFNLSRHTAGPQLDGLLNALCEKRIETLQHSRRVASYALLLGKRLGLTQNPADYEELRLGALMHDIGKAGVPENVIHKPGPLNAEEWRVMKMHPAIGYELLMPIPGMGGVAEIVYSHHEFFDGKGYPRGLSRDRIPLGARIFSVVDAFDAITSNRPYRPARPPSIARAEIGRMGGSQFDPLAVEHFLNIPDVELEAIGRLQADCLTGSDRQGGAAKELIPV